MKILLLGEYSNVHNTLARGLRTLGHEVTVASGGDYWKDYPRDIDLSRSFRICNTISFLWRLAKALPKMRGYDIVQLINPEFVLLKAGRVKYVYDYLRRNNKKIVLGAFGMDYYWVSVNDMQKPFRYSDFNLGETLRKDQAAEYYRKDYYGTDKERQDRYVVSDCDAIVACLYEYYEVYRRAENGNLSHKLSFIPLPLESADCDVRECSGKLRIHVGISKNRSAYKGTDIMLKAAKRIEQKYPEQVELVVSEGVPYAQYEKMVNGADVILDQLYSYTPAMNALMAMSKGIIVVGGGEPENYEILGESELRPIINVLPNEESVYDELEKLVTDKSGILNLKQQSREYVTRHHDYIKVARQYEMLYKKLLNECIDHVCQS